VNKNKPPPRGPQFPSIPPEVREGIRQLSEKTRQLLEQIPPERREQMRRMNEQAERLRERLFSKQAAEQTIEQAPAPKQATSRKGIGGRKPMAPALVEAAKKEYRRALKKNGRLRKHDSAADHLREWFAKSRWAKKVECPSPSSFERHVIRPVLAERGD
jgi:hypothetical protein